VLTELAQFGQEQDAALLVERDLAGPGPAPAAVEGQRAADEAYEITWG
jgi:hypothetical protein